MKFPPRLFSIAALLLSTLLSSCYQTMYFPDKVNTPGLGKAGEVKLAVAGKFQRSGPNSGDNNLLAPAADLAYGVTNHIGVMASYRSLSNSHQDEGENYGMGSRDSVMGGTYNLHYVEGGIGYYTRFGRVGRFEVYGGGGLGAMTRRGTYYPQYNFDTKYYKLFLQPAITITPGNNRVFLVSGGLRVEMIDYYTFNSPSPDTKYVVTGSKPTSRYRTELNSPYLYFGPFVNFEIGYKFVKFNIQFGTFNTMSEEAQELGQSPYMTIGLVFRHTSDFFK